MVHLVFNDFNEKNNEFSKILENSISKNHVELFPTSDKENVDKTIDDLF